jgi:hypothetical protein
LIAATAASRRPATVFDHESETRDAAFESTPSTTNTGEQGSPVSDQRMPPAPRLLQTLAAYCAAFWLLSLDFRPSEYAEQDCTDKHKNRANHHDVDLQGYVHEGASLIVDDEASLSENREPSRPTHLALPSRVRDTALILS